MIICFSGTGNSMAVAERLSERLGDKITVLDARSAEKPMGNPKEKRVIWVMPVHSWGMPKFVRRAIKTLKLDCDPDTDHFLVCTCGDDCGLIARMWRKALKRKGWRGKAAHSVFMPNTYVTLPGFDVDSAETAARKMAEMPERAYRIAHAIKCRSGIDNVHEGRMPWLKSRILYPLFMKFLTSPRPLRHTEECIKCGKCISTCPLNNITDCEGYPAWGDQCTMCLRCYHICPRHAVAYGRSTRNKGQWRGALTYLRASGDPEQPENE